MQRLDEVGVGMEDGAALKILGVGEGFVQEQGLSRGWARVKPPANSGADRVVKAGHAGIDEGEHEVTGGEVAEEGRIVDELIEALEQVKQAGVAEAAEDVGTVEAGGIAGEEDEGRSAV